jgi:glycosyltransferase involved in cell wall biosynthesis
MVGAMSVRLSLAMIVKNEHALIQRVLDDAAAVCEELIVVDTGSSDDTVELARAKGADVHQIEWTDDFAAARNVSFGKCSCDWVLWLDADDVLPDSTKDHLRELKEWLDDELDVIASPYHYAIADDGTAQLQLTRERLVRREAGLRWEGRVHECIPLGGTRWVHDADLIVEHHPGPERADGHSKRNLHILEGAIADGDRSPRTLFYYANELYDLGRYPQALDAYEQYLEVEGEITPDRYWALLYVAESARNLELEDRGRQAASAAILEDPSRAEAYVCLGRFHFDRREWVEALPLFTAATAAHRPTFGLVRNGDYLYAAWDFLSVCFDNLGRQPDALQAALRALPGNPQADRVRANIRLIVDNL